MKTQITARMVNGVNVDKLFETIEAIKVNPVIAKFKFRASNQWLGGGLNRSTVKQFHGAGETIDRKQAFKLDADEPVILLGQDTAANPVEYLLHALVSCMTSSIVYHAAAKGIQIEEIESKVEGTIDLHGYLGLRDDVRRGYDDIRMTFKIKADVSDEELQELCQLGATYSPVLDTVTNGVPVKVAAERK